MKDSKALYVYGVVPKGEGEIPIKGIDSDGPVRFFPFQDIAALVSEVDLQEFGESELAQNLKDLKWVTEKIWAHEKVLEKAMESRTVIPMKFGAIFISGERLEKILADSYEAFKDLLEKLDGHSEWGVKIYGDSEGLRADVEKTSARVQLAERERAENPPGMAYLMQRKLETTLAEEVDLEKGKRLQDIFNRLSAHAAHAKLGALTPRELTAKERPMIFHGIFLIAEEKVKRFVGEVANLTMEMSELGWKFQQVGPFPPYNFSEISPVKEVQR